MSNVGVVQGKYRDISERVPAADRDGSERWSWVDAPDGSLRRSESGCRRGKCIKKHTRGASGAGGYRIATQRIRQGPVSTLGWCRRRPRLQDRHRNHSLCIKSTYGIVYIFVTDSPPRDALHDHSFPRDLEPGLDPQRDARQRGDVPQRGARPRQAAVADPRVGNDEGDAREHVPDAQRVERLGLEPRVVGGEHARGEEAERLEAVDRGALEAEDAGLALFSRGTQTG